MQIVDTASHFERRLAAAEAQGIIEGERRGENARGHLVAETLRLRAELHKRDMEDIDSFHADPGDAAAEAAEKQIEALRTALEELRLSTELVMQAVDGGSDEPDPDAECLYCGNVVGDGHLGEREPDPLGHGCIVPVVRESLTKAAALAAKQGGSMRELTQGQQWKEACEAANDMLKRERTRAEAAEKQIEATKEEATDDTHR
jgi:hypothetical protein